METIIIYDEEIGYAKRLLEHISDKKGVPLKIKAFSDKEELIRFANTNNTDYLLVSEKNMSEDISEFEAKHTIVLSEENRGENDLYKKDGNEYLTIYKYQSAELIWGRFMEYYVETSCKNIQCATFGKKSQIISVYSPIARSGKTSFALTLGQVLAGRGTALYINMEEFSGLSEILAKEYRGDLSDLMYHYRRSPESVGIKLQAIVNKLHGMDYVPPMVYSVDIRNVKGKLWTKMIEDISATGMYDYIILDLSNMPEDVFEILDISDVIYMPVKNDRISMCKLLEYEKFVLRVEREEILNKTIKVKTPHVDNIEWSENYTEQLLWGETGDFVRRLIKEEVAC